MLTMTKMPNLVTEKQSNASKDSKIAKLSHELERVKLEVDQHIRSEKKLLKANVIQTCIKLSRKTSGHGLSVDVDSLYEKRES